jgi:hypothetical protein
LITCIARVLSSPPDNKARAVVIIIQW